jgi:hypothetical protein
MIASCAELTVKNALASTVVVAAIATLGDWIWASFLSRHLMAAGLVHGALLCLAMGAMVGRPVGRIGAGAAGGIVIGFAAAALFYALAPAIRYAAMFVSWFALWVLLALLLHRLASGASPALAATRGVVAGAASGLAFYLISGMWTRWDPQSVDYVDHFARWAFAFAPGFAAIQGGGARPPARATTSDII